MAKENLLGKKFGRLTVIRDYGRSENRSVIWLCKCECGNTHKVSTGKLKNGSVKSCGCLRRDMTVNKNHKHGQANTRLYSIWNGIKRRCQQPKCSSYNDYGGRGISLCKEWLDFSNFYNWSMNNGYDDSLSIDRIDVDGDYTPNNCRWVDSKIQQRNKRNNHYLTYNNETHPITEWADILGINKGTLESRITRYGWSTEKALNTPVKKCNRSKTNSFITFNGKTQTITQWAKDKNMSFNTLYSRIFNYHWSIEEALETPVRHRRKAGASA